GADLTPEDDPPRRRPKSAPRRLQYRGGYQSGHGGQDPYDPAPSAGKQLFGPSRQTSLRRTQLHRDGLSRHRTALDLRIGVIVNSLRSGGLPVFDVQAHALESNN